MKKFLLVLMVILLFTSGCAIKNPNNTSSPPKASTPLNKAHTAEITEMNTLKYFVPSTVTPDGSLFGMAGNNLTLWNPKTGEIKAMGSAWSGMLSPDATKLAYTNEQGLHILDVDTGLVTSVVQNPSQGNSSLALGLWSPNSGKFMYMFVWEWSSDYFIYNVESGEKTAYEFHDIPKFLSSPVDWLDSGLLFIVHANKSKSGEQEYRENGYRSDLMLADMDGNITPVTSLDDGQFILYGGTTSNNRNILMSVWGGGSKTSVGLLKIGEEKIDPLPVQENTVESSISPDGKFAMLITSAKDGRLSAQVFDLVSRTVICKKELTGYGPPGYFMWSKDGRAVYFGQLDDNDNGILYTVNIN